MLPTWAPTAFGSLVVTRLNWKFVVGFNALLVLAPAMLCSLLMVCLAG